LVVQKARDLRALPLSLSAKMGVMGVAHTHVEDG